MHKVVDEALVVATCKVAYPEACAALARCFREGALAADDYHLVVASLQHDWPSYFTLDVSDSIALLAGELAEKHRLRGFNAIHLAVALTLKAQVKLRVVIVCWDVRLWEAMSALDLEVLPEKNHPRLNEFNETREDDTIVVS